MAIVPADPSLWGLPSGSIELTKRGVKELGRVVRGRWRHAKTFQLPPNHWVTPDGRFIDGNVAPAVIPADAQPAHHVTAFCDAYHWEHDDGSLHDIDLTLRPNGSGDLIADNNDIHVRVSQFRIWVYDRRTGVGQRISVPHRPRQVSPNAVEFDRDGRVHRYIVTTSGLRYECEIAAPCGIVTVRERYLLTTGFDEQRDFILGDTGFTTTEDGRLSHKGVFSHSLSVNSRDSGKAFPEAIVAPLKRETGRWLTASVNTDLIPASAFPIVIDPDTTFTVATGADDGRAYGQGSYPPGPGYYDSTGTTFNPSKTKISSFIYEVGVGLARWNTGVLSDTDTVVGATYRGYVTAHANADTRNLVAEWVSPSIWPIDKTDLIEPVGTTAISGVGLGTFTDSVTNDVVLSNAAANVSLTGYTALRFGISGGQPTGANHITWASFEDTSGYTKPTLIVTTSSGGGPQVITGTASATATATGTLAGKFSLGGVITSAATLVGNLFKRQPVTGTATSQATTSADPSAKRTLDGAASATATATGDLSVNTPVGGPREVTGATTGTAASTGTASARRGLAGAIATLSTLSASAGRRAELTGTAIAEATAAALSGLRGAISGSTAAQAVMDATARMMRAVAGTAEAFSEAEGATSAHRGLTGTADAAATTTALESAHIALAGTAEGMAEATGYLSKHTEGVPDEWNVPVLFPHRHHQAQLGRFNHF